MSRKSNELEFKVKAGAANATKKEIHRKDQQIEKAEAEIERLQKVFQTCKLDKEAADRRIIRLVRNVEELEGIKEENERIKTQFLTVRENYQQAVTELKILRKQKKMSREGKGDFVSAGGGGSPLNIHQCPSCSKKSSELTEIQEKYKKEIMNKKKLEKEIELICAIQCPSCSTNTKELTEVRVKYQQEMMKTQNLNKEIENLQAERQRAIEGFKQHEAQIAHLRNEIKTLQTYCTEELGKVMEERLLTLTNSNEFLESELQRVKESAEHQVNSLKNELEMEQERSSHLIASGITEREEIESRWKKLWDQHRTFVQDQMETLKSNFETPLKSSHVREVNLQKELAELQERYDKSKDAWEEYRKTLFEQLDEWKFRFQQKCEILDEVRQSKIEQEIIMQKKLKDLDQCQFMLNKGVEERIQLQKKLETIQGKVKNFLQPTEDSLSHISLDHPALLHQNKSWFTLMDFKKLKEKMMNDLTSRPGTGCPSSSPVPTLTRPST